jgi:hypothetical protein
MKFSVWAGSGTAAAAVRIVYIPAKKRSLTKYTPADTGGIWCGSQEQVLLVMMAGALTVFGWMERLPRLHGWWICLQISTLRMGEKEINLTGPVTIKILSPIHFHLVSEGYGWRYGP